MDVKLSLEDRPESQYGARRPGLSAEEAVAVERLLSRVRLLAATEGLIVKVYFLFLLFLIQSRQIFPWKTETIK